MLPLPATSRLPATSPSLLLHPSIICFKPKATLYHLHSDTSQSVRKRERDERERVESGHEIERREGGRGRREEGGIKGGPLASRSAMEKRLSALRRASSFSMGSPCHSIVSHDLTALFLCACLVSVRIILCVCVCVGARAHVQQRHVNTVETRQETRQERRQEEADGAKARALKLLGCLAACCNVPVQSLL